MQNPRDGNRVAVMARSNVQQAIPFVIPDRHDVRKREEDIEASACVCKREKENEEWRARRVPHCNLS